MDITRLRIRFFGMVQGVGFRYRAYHAANSLGLCGWVENCPDGTVLCEVQGERSAIDAMLGMIAGGHYIEITDMKVDRLDVDESERGFSIRG